MNNLPDLAVFLTDVPGVFDKPPSKGNSKESDVIALYTSASSSTYSYSSATATLIPVIYVEDDGTVYRFLLILFFKVS